MSRARVFISLLVVVLLASAGYWGYQTYLAPAPPTPSPEPAGASTPALPALVAAEGRLEPARSATLAFRLAARVAEVLVQEGQPVEAGQTLIRLESADLDAAVAQARAAVSQAGAAVAQAQAAVAVAQAQLDQVRAGPRPEEIATAEAQLKAAQAAVGQSVAQRDQVTRGAEAGQVAAAEAQLAQALAQQKELQIAYDQVLDDIEFLAGPTEERTRFQLNAANEAVAAAQAALDQVLAGASAQTIQAYNSAVGVSAYQRDAAAARLALLKAGASPEQLAAAEAGLEQAEAQVRQAEAALEMASAGLAAAKAQQAQATLAAPFAGTVVRLDLEAGELATPGAPVVELADLGAWRVRTVDLAETDVVLVRVGQTAAITLDALADETFTGRVTEIAAVAETNRGNVTYAVTLELDPV
ncbi:MAG: efflux RND transporter periplasmic adaptor subunit, partial [Anaerolineales bacterium]|nr:efflux RND transporter periplasmic adaptor subunit [Anaerolineales bacterium]